MITTDFERILFLFLLENTQYLSKVDTGFFSVKELDTSAKVVKAYWNKFKQVPTKEQLSVILSDKKFNINKEYVEAIFETPLSKYDIDWVRSTTESWITWKTLDSSLTDVIEYVHNQKVSPENVSSIVQKVKDIMVKRNTVSFSNSLGLSFHSPENHIIDKASMITTNYRFMDNAMGGYAKKTLNIYVAPPNTGKTVFLCHDAAEYLSKGIDVLYITLEMDPRKILKRVGSKLLGINIREYDNIARDTEKFKQKLKDFRNKSLFDLGDLRVEEFPTSQGTVDDIESFVHNVEHTLGKKYPVVIVDYLNILRDLRNPNTENTYIKIKNISEDLRAFAQRNEKIVLTATQTGRSAFGASDINLENIAESAGLAHTADNIIAIIQTEDMNSKGEYWLKLLKVRDGAGKHMRCLLHIDYNYMTLSETDVIVNDI